MTQENQHVSDEQRVYEMSYLLVPTITEDTLPQQVGAVKEEIEQYADTFIEEQFPQLIDLAYDMEHVVQGRPKQLFSRAYFGWMKFYLNPAQAAAIDQQMKRRDEVIRFLLIKTVPERTVSTKRSYKEETLSRKRSQADAAGEPLDAAAVDQKIDALVTDEEE